MNKRNHGFTLIELMIAVAIVGILAAIAYPSYLDQVRKSKRSDARSLVLQTANRQERYFTTHYEYAGSMKDLGYKNATVETENKAYSVTASASGTNKENFTITATAINDQDNDDCRTMSINQIGEKTANNAAASANISTQCW